MARAGWKSFILVQHNLVVAGVATIKPATAVAVSASLHSFLFKAALVLDSSRSYQGSVVGWCGAPLVQGFEPHLVAAVAQLLGAITNSAWTEKLAAVGAD